MALLKVKAIMKEPVLGDEKPSMFGKKKAKPEVKGASSMLKRLTGK